ncbi:hypothetical protein DAPPUDRAFT_113117 [Daphnia pulex]|uniref:Uncharacterized protein n=1 Tax=Daphnia pulex TaxID=6669 RepID=E9HE44_DAPPU|nr:hypothetical protein DAPPUDRAFT_113117 [Daphnia pulex]|eukprot:EFX69949.1 hypothetical protein DAPPUDRAFT_113117 [Daphnia pulex]
MPITTRCRRRDDAIFDDATTSITTRCLAVITKSSNRATGKRIAKQSDFTLDQSSPDFNGAQVTRLVYKSRLEPLYSGVIDWVSNPNPLTVLQTFVRLFPSLHIFSARWQVFLVAVGGWEGGELGKTVSRPKGKFSYGAD